MTYHVLNLLLRVFGKNDVFRVLDLRRFFKVREYKVKSIFLKMKLTHWLGKTPNLSNTQCFYFNI